MPKTTRSQDGKHRQNWQFPLRVGLDEIAIWLSAAYIDHDVQDEGPLGDLSAVRIRRAVFDTMACALSDRVIGWADGYDDEWADEVSQWAAEQVRQAFPELDPAQTPPR